MLWIFLVKMYFWKMPVCKNQTQRLAKDNGPSLGSGSIQSELELSGKLQQSWMLACFEEPITPSGVGLLYHLLAVPFCNYRVFIDSWHLGVREYVACWTISLSVFSPLSLSISSHANNHYCWNDCLPLTGKFEFDKLLLFHSKICDECSAVLCSCSELLKHFD